MAEEENPRNAEEGEWVDSSEEEKWRSFRIQVGDVLEFETSLVLASGLDASAGYASMIVLEVGEASAHGVMVRGRFLGCNNKEVGKALTNHMNRRRAPLHLCWHLPCGYTPYED